MYNRTLSEIMNALVEAKFKIEKIIEPDSRKKYPYDPWCGLWGFTSKFMNKVPPTIIFKLKKIK